MVTTFQRLLCLSKPPFDQCRQYNVVRELDLSRGSYLDLICIDEIADCSIIKSSLLLINIFTNKWWEHVGEQDTATPTLLRGLPIVLFHHLLNQQSQLRPMPALKAEPAQAHQ